LDLADKQWIGIVWILIGLQESLKLGRIFQDLDLDILHVTFRQLGRVGHDKDIAIVIETPRILQHPSSSLGRRQFQRDLNDRALLLLQIHILKEIGFDNATNAGFVDISL
jgi:hypothetical protein